MTRVSVVIPSVNGLPGIEDCLGSLERQRTDVDYEVIVANRCRDGTAEHVGRRHPWAKLLDYDEPVSIPELRARAMAVATGDIIAMTEDHCVVSEDWISALVGALDAGYMVAGGSVENGKTGRIIDWSAFFCEYSAAMPPIPDGEVDGVAGNNAAYRREALEMVEEEILRDFWEYFLMAELREKGVRFLSAPAMRVIHEKEFGFVEFLSQRFHYSRSFAGMRRRRMGSVRLVACALGSPALPLLHFGRTARDVFRKKRFYKEFLLSVPFLAAFLLAYAAGEFTGYLWGGGTSLSRVQ